jgi:hypothetical protein
MITSFRMTSFASREAMTTAEPPEPLDFVHDWISFSANQTFWSLSARRRGIFCLFCVFCGL